MPPRVEQSDILQLLGTNHLYSVEQALMVDHDIGKALDRRENSKDTLEARCCLPEVKLSLHRTIYLSIAEGEPGAKRP